MQFCSVFFLFLFFLFFFMISFFITFVFAENIKFKLMWNNDVQFVINLNNDVQCVITLYNDVQFVINLNKIRCLFRDSLKSKDILFGETSGNISFIFEHPIICKTVNISTNLTTSSSVCLVFIGRLITDWLVENINPYMTLYRM